MNPIYTVVMLIEGDFKPFQETGLFIFLFLASLAAYLYARPAMIRARKETKACALENAEYQAFLHQTKDSIDDPRKDPDSSIAMS
ncbi:hypothetical protein ACFL54_09985, partial [Planctomycetota bacterium]